MQPSGSTSKIAAGQGLQSGANPNAPDGADESNYRPPGKVDILEEKVLVELQKAQNDLENYTQYDKSFRRRDTVEVVKDILKRVKEAASEINSQSEDIREKLYYLIYNATIVIFKACHQLRRANFSIEATHFLAFNILCLDNNLILTTIKYMDWRILNYTELARAYADFGAVKAASKVINYGIQKALYAKQVEEQDPPVPEGTKDTLIDALRVLRTQELKYELQSGSLSADAWKKKLEETFANNKYHRSLAIVECLQTNDPFASGEKQQAIESKIAKIKAEALKVAFELVKGDVELVKQALVQIHEKKKRDREKKDKLANRDPDVDLDELLDKYKQMDAEMILEKDWKFAATNVPIEIHVEMVKLTYECKLWREFEALLDPALVRLKFRRYEIPYLSTVDVLMSQSKVANIPNGFEKLPKDMNQANLRIELKKLRATSKRGTTSKEEPKKEEAKKKEPPPKEDKKGGKKDPKAPQQQQAAEENDKPIDPDEIQATQGELDAIGHIYVHMLLQRTKKPQNAIVGLEVVLANENLGPELQDNHFAVAVPIRQHPGAYEKAGLIPYIVFRRTANSLIDEEDSLSIITDVCVIQGQDPHMRAPLGFTRIDVDLRQTPKDLERIPNLDYVFVCYKTDRQLALAERDLLILRRLAELEKSYVQQKTDQFKQLDEAKQFLRLQYNQDLLVDLSNTIKEALLGPLGDYYLEQRFDLLNEVTGLLWTKYLIPVLQKIDQYVEMRGQKEYFGEFMNTIDEAIIRIRHDFVDALNIMHRILTRTEYVQDIVFYCKCSIYLSNLQEEIGEFRNAVQALRAALGKIVEYREERMKRSLDSNADSNPTTAMSITIDNRKIGELEQKMQTIYNTWEELVLRKERDRERKEAQSVALDEDEGDEEQLEVKQCIDELRDKDLFERDIDLEEWQQENKKRTATSDRLYFSEIDQICHSLHADILLNLYRCEIKLGKELDVVKKQTSELLKTQGIDLSKNAPGNMTKNLSGKLNQKMSLAKGKTLSQNKGALKNLQQTLQEAGKMPPSKPQILSFEKILEKENNQNPYQNALLYMALAMAKTNVVEQKSLLLEAIEFLKKARLSEESLTNLALDSAVYLKAARCFHEYFRETPDQVHPFGLLAKPIYIKKTVVPVKPVMVCRTSTSITMKLPFFKPLTEYKAWRNISEVALYGKPSGSGVAVSLNNTDYPGTGEKKAPGGVVNVTGLIPNERYVFAAGGYTSEGHCVNGIGETSNEILTLLPLSLHQLYGYLAEIAFKLGHYQIARQAAETFCQQFLIKNEFEYSMMNTKINPLIAFRLDQNYFSKISMVEAKQLAESFLILAQVSKLVRNEVQRKADHAELQLEKQKIDMKIANFLTLALEISTYLNRPSLTKRVVAELYNHLVPYFQMKLRPQILLHVLIKCHQSIRLIPSELIDQNTRRIMGCLSYQVIRIGQEQGENSMLRRVMISELPITSRKWRKYSQYVIQRPQLSEDEQEKLEDQKKRLELGETIPPEELIKEPEPYEERLYKLDEFEDEGHAFEEFLLSIVDFQDIVKAKTEQWKLQIQTLQDSISAGDEVVTTLKEQVAVKVDFWEQVKLNKPSAQLQQLITAQEAGTENPRYLEFCCKCIRRALEIGDYESFDLLIDKIKNGVKIPEDDEAVIENLINERIGYLEKDIVRKQRKRFDTLEQKVQQLLEHQSLTGGNNTLGPKKLQQLVSGDKVIDDESNIQAIMQFNNQEEEQQKMYSYLWISERYSLLGMTQFLGVVSSSAQRSQLEVTNKSCVFNDIYQLDFKKFKQTLEEYQDEERLKKLKFQEIHKDDNQEYAVEIDDRIQRVTDLLKVMARAAEYAKASKSWLQLVNIIRYIWNIFAYDLTNPLELTKGDGWHYVLLIAESSICLIEYLQKGGTLRKIAGRSIDQVQNQQPSFDKDLAGKSVAFKFDATREGVDGEVQAAPARESQPNSNKASNSSSKGQKWYETIDEFDVSLFASLIGFTVQSLMSVAKWESLVDLSNRLNASTSNEFASQLLPFIIYAQGTLHSEAARSTAEKRKALEIRVQQFENWKLTSKKKRSRQAMLTGEIPPEEQEFNRDKQQLEKEIFRLDVIENVLLADKRESDHLLENIKRDANNCVESIKTCRKLYHQFGIDTQALLVDEKRKGTEHFEINAKRKGHKVFTSMVIQNYKKCIEQLEKRHEKFLLIQALHELGNLYYAGGYLGDAETAWNDCVDTIFQRLYVVKEFRTLFAAQQSLADSFGSQQVLIGGIVLTKLAKLCYEGRDLYKYSECLLMSAELFAAPAKLSLPHPQVNYEYTNYTFREFMGKNFFTDQYILQPSELVTSLGVATQALIDDDLFEKALPLAALMEYIASDVTRSKILTVKARLMRATALVELGYINEAFMIYQMILNRKDLPDYGAKYSEFSLKQDGKNFKIPSDSAYHNHLPPEADENQAAIKMIQDPIPEDIETAISTFCSPYLVESLQFLRCLLLIRIGQTENVKNLDKQELRQTILKTAEDSLRASLKRIQLAEEIAHLKGELKLHENKIIDKDEQVITILKDQLTAAYEKGAIVEDRQNTYYANTEEELCHADQRSQRLSLILRIRAAIGRIQESLGFNLESFYVLRQGLSNFKALAEGQFKEVEKGTEPESKGTFKFPEQLAAASGAPAAGGKKDKAPPKDAKGKAPVVADSDQKKEDEEQIKAANKENEKLKAVVELLEKRSHPNIILWLKTKISIIKILLAQKRYEDCADAIAITRLEAQSVGDRFFSRKLLEIEFQIQVQSGDLREALRTAEEIRKHAKKLYQHDLSYTDFLGNLSELLYVQSKSIDARQVAEEARQILWTRLQLYGCVVDAQNINGSNDVQVWNDRKKVTEEDLEIALANVPVAAAAGAGGKGAPPAKGGAKQAPPAKGAPPVEEGADDSTQSSKSSLDFSKPVEYKLSIADLQSNSSQTQSNIYLLGLETLIRIDLRLSQYLTLIEKKHIEAKDILLVTAKLASRTLYLSPQLQFYQSYLLGHVNLQIFYDKVMQFQQKFMQNPKYKESFTSHVPFNSIALGNFMLELPKFSNQLQGELKQYLIESEQSLNEAINVARAEAVLCEFDFTVREAFRTIAETCFLISEYRSRILTYKYASFQEQDQHRKLERLKEKKRREAQEAGENDDLDDGLLHKEMKEMGDKWDQHKADKEHLEVHNYRIKAAKYLDAAVEVATAQSEFQDKQHELSQVNLTDVNKIPKEIISELFEASQVNKVATSKLPDFEFKDKTMISSAELLAQTRAIIYECCMLTFGTEKNRLSKLISKLHRYLVANLSSYTQKCTVKVPEIENQTDATKVEDFELRPVGHISASWFDFQGQNSSLFYNLGPYDEVNLKKPDTEVVNEEELSEAQRRELTEERVEKTITHFGKVEADPLILSRLYQDTRDLIDKMKISETKSEAVNERDRKYYKKTYHSLIERLGNIFKPPITSEEEQERDVDCLALVQDVIPELTVENVQKLADVLRKDAGCCCIDPALSAILRKFHRVRYIK